MGGPAPGQGSGGQVPGPGPDRPSLRPAHSPQQFSMQMDLIRQQLEFESQHIRTLMEERFGTSDEMVQRAQVRRRAGPRRGYSRWMNGDVGKVWIRRSNVSLDGGQ